MYFEPRQYKYPTELLASDLHDDEDVDGSKNEEQ